MYLQRRLFADERICRCATSHFYVGTPRVAAIIDVTIVQAEGGSRRRQDIIVPIHEDTFLNHVMDCHPGPVVVHRRHPRGPCNVLKYLEQGGVVEIGQVSIFKVPAVTPTRIP